MKVQEGYRPKVKFSVSFFPETYERLCSVCKEQRMHRANFIEQAVLARLEDGLRPRTASPSLMRSSKNLRAPTKRKKQDVGMLSRKPRRKP